MSVKTTLVGRPTADYQSAKHDVHINGKHVASIYHHPEDDGEGRWEVMKPHSNKEWEDNNGDDHHTWSMHKSKGSAVDEVVHGHLKTEDTHTKTLDAFLDESYVHTGRSPGKPYVKPYVVGGERRGWKSSNKWGKVRYWQDFAKDAAIKHAGITEGTYHVHVKNNGKPAGKIAIWALDQKHAEEKAGNIVGKKPFCGHTVEKVTLAEVFVEDIELTESTSHTVSRVSKLPLERLRSQTSYWQRAHRNASNDSMRRMTSDIYHAHRKELARRSQSVNEGIKIEKGDTTESGTRHEYRTSRIIHNGKHVATVNTYRGRAGNWMSQVDHPDGSSAHKKYGITLDDYTKADMLKKVKAYHKQQTESVRKVVTDCPKCERELASDRYCSRCDHYVDKKGNVSYNHSPKDESDS